MCPAAIEPDDTGASAADSRNGESGTGHAPVATSESHGGEARDATPADSGQAHPAADRGHVGRLRDGSAHRAIGHVEDSQKPPDNTHYPLTRPPHASTGGT